MPDRNYYIVLGVPREESAAGIRAAFRDLAKRHHPDRAGPEGASRFREVAEAYRVLGDSAARRRYDDLLRRSEGGSIWRHREPRRTAREPFTDEPLDVLGDPPSPFTEELRARFLGNFTTRGHPKAERAEPLQCHVLLSRAEALSGGILPIRIPVLEGCRSCHGSGHVWPFPCIDCNASGTLQRSAVLEVPIPAGVTSGSRFAIGLQQVGIANLHLEVLVRVAGGR